MDQAIGNTGSSALMSAGQAARAGEHGPMEADDGVGAERKQLYAGREWSRDHPLNIRVSIPLGAGRYYITLVAGKERRARARLALDRRQNPLDTPGNVLFLSFVATVVAAGSLTLLYLLLAHVFGWSGRLML